MPHNAPSARAVATVVAVAAIRERASGQRVERREVGPPCAFEAMADDELERALVERFSALGLE